MIDKEWDIIVVGGGIAGLTATSLLSKLHLKVLCIEPQKPPEQATAETSDLRSTAYLIKAIDLLKEAGLWKDLKDHAEQLKTMRICDAGEPEGPLQETSFDSKELGLPYFGYNIPNWFAKKSILSVINSFSNSKIIFGIKAVGLINYIDKSILKLSDGKMLSAKLIIAADGKDSDIRFLSNIEVKKWDNCQDAIACMVTHENDHEGASIEILETGGPCTLVPLKSLSDGKFRSAVVWMEKRPQAKQLMLLNDKNFSIELSSRTKFVLGQCNLDSKRTIYPITSQLAKKFYEGRVALIAEAAHVMPPIGAQGLNTSFEDISLLVKLLKKAIAENSDIGAPSLLREYGNLRRRITRSKMLGVNLLNNTSKSDFILTKRLRKFGLSLINRNTILKTSLMKTGLGKFNLN